MDVVSGDDLEPLIVEDDTPVAGGRRRNLLRAGLVAIVFVAVAVAAAVGIGLGRISSKERVGVLTTQCSGKLVLLHEEDLPAEPLQVMADLRAGGAASLPLTTDQVLLASGNPLGHQSFRPTTAALTLAFRLPPSAKMAAEIQDENGTVLRRTRLAPLVDCESPYRQER